MTENKTIKDEQAPLYDTEKYFIERTEEGLGEDGKYGREGYAVVNKETGVVEHTTTILPSAVFQCQHFNDTLISLLMPKEQAEVPIEDALLSIPTEDVVPN